MLTLAFILPIYVYAVQLYLVGNIYIYLVDTQLHVTRYIRLFHSFRFSRELYWYWCGQAAAARQQRHQHIAKRGRIFSHFSSLCLHRGFFYDWRRRLSWFLSRTNSHPFLMFYCANSTGCELGFSYSYIISYKNI